MSSLQKIDSKAYGFSNAMRDRSKKAASWAGNLKLGTAVLNIIIWLLSAVPWFIGRLFYFLKWLAGMFVMAFRVGAKMG